MPKISNDSFQTERVRVLFDPLNRIGQSEPIDWSSVYTENKKKKNGHVLYWMQRDQRVKDNWALLVARKVAEIRQVPLVVCFNIIDFFYQAPYRHYHFMINGLKKVEKSLHDLRIPFFLLRGNPVDNVLRFVKQQNVSYLITDQNPLRMVKEWKSVIAQKITMPFWEVDAHNIIPVWEASSKQEYGAYTLRPKINKKLPHFLLNIPVLATNPPHSIELKKIDWEKVDKIIQADRSVQPVDWLQPGEDAAWQCLYQFMQNRLSVYAKERNDPNKEALSDLSPYLHFGQISSQRIALEIKKIAGDSEAVLNYLEELIVRRELADNFCFYNPNYDSVSGFPDWARKTLLAHSTDKRAYFYDLEQWEQARTQDPLWNAAQISMVRSGKMHGYLRMYWAKKILEWSPNPEKAMETAIYLNDKYELDGRDPNGYTGIAWSIGGVHDRAWPEREVFGQIRYMNANGAKRKFDVEAYIQKWLGEKKLF